MKRCLPVIAMACMTTCMGANSTITQPAEATVAVTGSVPPAAKTYHYKLFAKPDGTYGYDIFTGNKKLIHQLTIPGRSGNKGFAREQDAAKVAGLVIGKLQQNIFPPAVTAAELKQLGVL